MLLLLQSRLHQELYFSTVHVTADNKGFSSLLLGSNSFLISFQRIQMKKTDLVEQEISVNLLISYVLNCRNFSSILITRNHHRSMRSHLILAPWPTKCKAMTIHQHPQNTLNYSRNQNAKLRNKKNTSIHKNQLT